MGVVERHMMEKNEITVVPSSVFFPLVPNGLLSYQFSVYHSTESRKKMAKSKKEEFIDVPIRYNNKNFPCCNEIRYIDSRP